MRASQLLKPALTNLDRNLQATTPVQSFDETLQYVFERYYKNNDRASLYQSERAMAHFRVTNFGQFGSQVSIGRAKNKLFVVRLLGKGRILGESQLSNDERQKIAWLKEKYPLKSGVVFVEGADALSDNLAPGPWIILVDGNGVVRQVFIGPLKNAEHDRLVQLEHAIERLKPSAKNKK